ncbi:uncharacterized protein BP5553_05020 [Venustampulla echinocandica]|uniref:Uncharacterized protein n=1 Tax=Venustampulla echinocandica TaxID=2656787 RepID=A0A370TPY3_9HELO|nr:uncharacterized protein BP5553_05020 [Venustampulla echinocandica]RDL37587.1 hypothetical protein BP5553_05020 [Venustampulla echinocandica]
MVVFVDLDDENEPPEDPRLRSQHWTRTSLNEQGDGKKDIDPNKAVTRDNPNKSAITEALGCYPIVISISSHIDLNTLDALARTCWQIRANLLQFRKQLLTSTLYCENADVELNPEHTFRYRARAADWYFVDAGREVTGATGKAGNCARDMVGGCRRCGRVVCRNCTIKPPAPVLLHHRHRRICTACSSVPLSSLINPSSTQGRAEHTLASTEASTDIPKSALCNCASEGVWLCQPCGRSLRSADAEYESIWKWRTRYLLSLGGLGVGFGEGNRGVPCGRGEECVAAREVEQEIDCDAEDAREIDSRAASPSSSPGSSTESPARGIGQMGPGYARHEIEGIGGVVKKKLVRMVKVGACVPEWGAENHVGKFLVREVEGRARSWCGWCWRVIPGPDDTIG